MFICSISDPFFFKRDVWESRQFPKRFSTCVVFKYLYPCFDKIDLKQTYFKKAVFSNSLFNFFFVCVIFHPTRLLKGLRVQYIFDLSKNCTFPKWRNRLQDVWFKEDFQFKETTLLFLLLLAQCGKPKKMGF